MTDNRGSSASSSFAAGGPQPEPDGSSSSAAASTSQPAVNGDSRPSHTPRSGIYTSSLSVSRSTSTSASPQPSRDSSPAGRVFRQQQQSAGAAAAAGMRPRKDSHDASPHRPPSITGHTVPSAAAIQRALSAAAAPQLQPPTVSESSSKLPRASRANSTTSLDNAPSWPISPRLKSPPPSGSRRESIRSPRKAEIAPMAPSIVVRPSSSDRTGSDGHADPESQASAPSKAGSRGASGAPALETVQEASLPATPETVASSSETKFFDHSAEDIQALRSGTSTPQPVTTSTSKMTDSGSDHDRPHKEDEVDPESTPKARTVATRSSYSSLKPKSGVEPTTRNMTVETETVTSIPQSTLGPPSDRVASGRTDHGGTLRVKASNETIRPGKGRKKASRKAPSINATSASTRADIFEDRVKNAMDEATSDDSDETFVYESNPHEPPVRRSRHHSRTPSANSLASMEQRVPMRTVQSALSTQKTRSMKFANPYSSGPDDEALERPDGTIRASNGRNAGSSVHHHHLGRTNRNTTGHTSILDDDNSPFPQLNKTRSLTGMPGRQSQNARYAARNLLPSNGTSRKGDGYNSYDLDAEGGDDERTPLMGSTRTTRSARRSIQTPRPRYPEHYPRHQRSFLSRCAGFIVLVIMLLLLAFGVVGFLFAISTPLSDVSIVEIQKVLATEQEIMFDLVVEAVNPNLLPINIGDMDIDVFAKSKYVESERWWRLHGNDSMSATTKTPKRKSRAQRLHEYVRHTQSTYAADDDPLEDPPTGDDPEPHRRTMLLGRIDHFDNPLSFDGSFWKRHAHYSTGSLRLSKPGNRTEMGGTERWERVLLHDFDLIVRGTLKYKIPLGGRAYSANVNQNTTVRAETGIEAPSDNAPGSSPVDRDGRVKSSSSR